MKNLKQTMIGMSLVVTMNVWAVEPIETLEATLKKNADFTQARLVKIVQSNPKFEKGVKNLLTEFNVIQRSGKDFKIQAKMMESELIKQSSMLSQIYGAAKFDELKYHEEQMKIVSAYNQKNKQKVQYTKKGKLSYRLIELPDFKAPTEGAEIELTKPFPLKEVERNGHGVIEILNERGSFSTEADGENFSKFSNLGGLGHIFEVPSNTHRVRVSADVPEVYSNYFGVANLGGGMGKTKLKIVVEGEDRVICTKTKTLDTGYVYFLDIQTESSLTSISLACEFPAPPAGQRIVIRFLGSAIVDTGLANMNTELTAEPSAIRIRLNPLQ